MKEEKELTISSEMESLEKLIDFTRNFKHWAQLDKGKRDDIMLILTEAVTNAIVHGNNNDPEKDVKIQAKFTDGKITFIIEDEGNGFNPDQVPNPLDSENLLKTGGRGIYLMNYYADFVHYSDKGNKVTIEFDF
ncbi:MAG TPA: ATP-binding protein [Balneolales bacterium]|nr:ATP-binding protein [Balneolales bacterium]